MRTTSARNATHGTRHQHAMQPTSLPPRLISLHVSKSKNMHVSATVKAMPLSSPWCSWRPCVISRFTASLMPLLLSCSPPVKNNKHNNNPPQLTTSTSVTLLLLFRPSAIKRPPTSVKPFFLCITRRHTRHQPPSIKSHSHPHFKHHCTMSRPLPLTCPCLPSRSSSGA